jgi:hypothetical protein
LSFPDLHLTSGSSATTDAREFGQHYKAGGWRMGLLVTRNDAQLRLTDSVGALKV